MDQAKRYIIHQRPNDAYRLVYDTMMKNIGPGCFEEGSIELLPAFFLLAEAQICLNPPRLKKAENFLVSAYWNLLKSTSDESEKRADDDLVSEKDISRFKAGLHKTFGRFFLAQNTPDAFKQACEHLTKGIYLESMEFGPESYRMCSAYYYMGDLFRKNGENPNPKAKAFFSKIVQIWKAFILDSDFDPMQEYTYSCIEPIYYEEAEQHLRNMLIFFEMDLGQNHPATAECQFTYGLVGLKIGNVGQAHEAIKAAHDIYANNLGEFDEKTKEVGEILQNLEERLQPHMDHYQDQ